MGFTLRHWLPAGKTTVCPVCARSNGPDYYAAFIVDPDGYRIEAYYGPPEI
jgi:hypothetical protein